MNEYLNDIEAKISNIKIDINEINNLIKWAWKTINKFESEKENDNISLLLIHYLLLRLRNIYFDVDMENFEIDQENLTDSIKEYFKEELDDIVKFVRGEKNYIKTSVIQRNLLEEFYDLFGEILKDAEKLISGIILSNDSIEHISKSVKTIKEPTHANIIFIELVQTILNLNEALKYNRDKILVGGYGLIECSLPTEYIKNNLKDIIHIIKGNNPYKFSICINKTSIMYMNFNILY